MKPRRIVVALLASMLMVLSTAASAQAPVKRVETALPQAGQLPTWNPLPSAPGVHDEKDQSSIEARVLHFLFHLFGGPKPRPLHSPFSNECGQRPCPFDQRN